MPIGTEQDGFVDAQQVLAMSQNIRQIRENPNMGRSMTAAGYAGVLC